MDTVPAFPQRAVGGGDGETRPKTSKGTYGGQSSYEVALTCIPSRGRNDRFRVVNLAYRSKWSEEGPADSSGKKPDVARSAANAFTFPLDHGAAAVRRVIPPTARKGGVYAVVWVPKAAKASK